MRDRTTDSSYTTCGKLLTPAIQFDMSRNSSRLFIEEERLQDSRISSDPQGETIARSKELEKPLRVKFEILFKAKFEEDKLVK
uniref:Uncharacterized protein n=1 Tax=Angiostrongylus cantonensis TaxID=6313 RepID=A0A0K0D3D1_ANGCA